MTIKKFLKNNKDIYLFRIEGIDNLFDRRGKYTKNFLKTENRNIKNIELPPICGYKLAIFKLD